jgi:hypothetical protein
MLEKNMVKKFHFASLKKTMKKIILQQKECWTKKYDDKRISHENKSLIKNHKNIAIFGWNKTENPSSPYPRALY